MENLANKKCIPCETAADPLKGEEIKALSQRVDKNWDVIGEKKIERKFSFKDFKENMIFVNKIAEVAEADEHHPDLFISYSKLTVTLLTHNIGGLSENDFIVAAKIDQLAH